MWASTFGNADVVACLLQHNAAVDIENRVSIMKDRVPAGLNMHISNLPLGTFLQGGCFLLDVL